MTASPIQLDAKLFHKRLRLFCAHMKNAKKQGGDPLGDVDTVLIKIGVPDDTTVYQKSTALHFWFFGYEFPETIIAINMETMSILTSPKKGAILEGLNGYSEKLNEIAVHKKGKDPGEQQEYFDALWKFMQASGGHKKMGILQKDKAVSPMISDWDQFIESKGVEMVDVTSSIANILVIKDEEEQNLVRSAAKCTSIIMQDFVVDQILSIIDDEKKVTHEQLSEKIENTIVVPEGSNAKKPKLKFPTDVNMDYTEMCYPPIIQSGGVYSLRPSAVSSSENLHFGTIICSLGVRYKSYCSNVARTFLIEPNKQQEKDYKFLLELQKYVASLVKPGATTSDIYAKGLDYVKKNRPELEKHLINNFGFSMGVEFRESDYVLGAKNHKELAIGMVFSLAVGFQDIVNKDPPKKDAKADKYSLLLIDTILVTKQEPVIVTEGLKKLEDVSYFFKNEDDGDEEEEEEKKTSRPLKHELAGSGAVMKTRLRKESRAIDENSTKKRDMHQKELLQSRIREALAKYTDSNADDKEDNKTTIKEFECYRKDVFLPKEVKDLKIFVDKRNDCVVIPVYGLAVPFHISTIKNVSKSDEGEFVYLRINFNSPGRTIGKKEAIVPFDDPTAQFVRAITYRSADTHHMNAVYKEITDLRKAMTNKENEKKEMADLVHQDTLAELKGRRPIRLGDVYMRPVMEGKRIPGDLEIHSNGIRYRNMIKADQKCDILFSNIKHVFFQPCDNEMIILIHLHLKHPIMIGKKKTKDIQFYREALEAIVDETGSRRRRIAYGDEDEIVQEQDERKRRAALNVEFKSFCEKLSAADGHLTIDIPVRELGFYGVPFRQNVLLQPTRDCLVHLTDPPFLVVPLAEVEVASLERILFGLKNFDIIFIFKDHSMPPQHVDSIPMNYLEPVKEWLNSSDVFYMQSNINFNWSNIMKTVNDDPVGFYEMGGWEVIQANPDDPNASDEEDEEDDDSVYNEEEDEEEDADDDEDEEEDEEAYNDDEDDDSEFDEDEDDEDEDEEDEEEGMDWDELEEKTKREEIKAKSSGLGSAAKRTKPAITAPVKKRK